VAAGRGHGGQVFRAARELGIPWEGILDFSASLNPLGQPPGLKERLIGALAASAHYPEEDGGSFVKAVSDLTGLPPEAILPGAGSTPLIRALVRAIRPRRPAILAPAYGGYAEGVRSAFPSLGPLGGGPRLGPVAHVLAREEDGFEPGEGALAELRGLDPDLIFLANPANPTGRLVPEGVLSGILALSLERGIPLILDEAFLGFTPRGSLEGAVMGHPWLLVLRSLTKIFAIPGLRLAYLAAHPDTLAPLRRAQEPWPVGGLALEAGIWSIPQAGFLAETRAATAALRPILEHALSPLGKTFPSDCNFVLLRLLKGGPGGLAARLRQRGILVRDCSGFAGLGEGFLRFAVRPRGEIEALGAALGEYGP
jgi:threonine-phosphate decarboxylase